MALRIKELRESRGLSQVELADKVGVSKSQMSEIENEVRHATQQRLVAIAKALGVPIVDLFTADAREAYRGEIEALMTEMSEQDQRALLRMAQALARRAG